MRRELAIRFPHVTESTAPAGYKWLECGNENITDGVMVSVMRIILNQINIDGTIVIGEGEIDEAPTFYVGGKVGTDCDGAVDIAVDPIEGMRIAAMGQTNALTALAVDDKGCLLNTSDMYMKKLTAGPGAESTTSLNLPLTDDLHNVATTLGRPLSELTITIPAKLHHDVVIAEMQQLGVRVFAISDGDVVASILICTPDSEASVLYGIDGALEGVVSAAAIRVLDGDTNDRLLTRHDAKGGNEENRRIGEQELARCKAMDVEVDKVLHLGDMTHSDNIIFSVAGITEGDLLEGISRKDNITTAETLLVCGKSRTIRHIQSIRYLDRKGPGM